MFVRALGTAQDGGVPHLGCYCDNCNRARLEPRHTRTAACLLLDSGQGERYLIDATCDMKTQLERLDPRPSNAALVDAVLLTHAHIGHYSGLMHFGKEVMNTRSLAVWCTPAMAWFIRQNAPWSELVKNSNIMLMPEFVDRKPVSFGRLSITPFCVPHRNEFADTVGFRIEGMSRTLVYLPDIDSWKHFEKQIAHEMSHAHIALIDATFYSPEEISARSRSFTEVPHPPVAESMDMLQQYVDSGKLVYFTHLNHTNPLLDPDSAQYKSATRRGFRVLSEDESIQLT